MTDSTHQISRLLHGAVESLSLDVSESQIRQLTTHFELLLLWNRKINLSAIREPRQIAARHFEESLFLGTLLSPPDGMMIDVGSGAGFPGLPLKVIWPQLSAVLLEPNQKKVTFLNEVIRQCGLGRIRVAADRLEAAARGELAGRVSLITMRAVAVAHSDLGNLSQLLANNGQVALFLGEDDAQRVTHDSSFRWLRMDVIPNSLHRVIVTGTPNR